MRISFIRVLGMPLGNGVLNARTLWMARERLEREDCGSPAPEVLFARISPAERTAGYIPTPRQIFDATLG